MNINNAFPSKYLKSGDIPEDSDLALTIKSVAFETVGQGEDAETKPIIYFAETDKGLVLNKTNANAIAHLYGPETDAWTGKRISLFSTEVDFAGKMTLALRVRLKAPKAEANGSQAVKLWQRWNELVTEAGQFKVKVPALDAAASEADIISAGKALAQAIAEAKAF